MGQFFRSFSEGIQRAAGAGKLFQEVLFDYPVKSFTEATVSESFLRHVLDHRNEIHELTVTLSSLEYQMGERKCGWRRKSDSEFEFEF